MKKLLTVLLLLALFPAVNAQSNFDIGTVSIEQLQEIVVRENIAVPESMRFMVKENERINLIIPDTLELNTVLDDYAVTTINEGLLDDPTIEVIATRGAVNAVSRSKNIKETLADVINNGEIQVNPQGFFGKIKYGFAKLFLRFL